MTAPVTRFTIATPVPSTTRTGGYDMAYTDIVLASDYERLEQECERLRALLADILAADDGALDELRAIGIDPAPETTELTERIRATLQVES